MPQEPFFYPHSIDAQKAASNMTKGNFGLWYNKFIPVKTHEDKKDAYKACAASGNVTEVVEFYHCQYKQMQRKSADTIKKLLATKHQDQSAYCHSFPDVDYEAITIRAELKTPLITGIGESHPHEVSMVFDHNMGIPYIPATGMKGIVRFAHTLSIFLNESGQIKNEFKDKETIDESITDIPDIFGGEKSTNKEKKEILRGKVVFLDAYPENIPALHVDIMNPHYGDYYSDKEGKTPPADYLSPKPIKFLTVANGEKFLFRAIAEKKDDLPEKVRAAFTKALTEEGVGAKTAVGYGRFEITETQPKTKPAATSLNKTEEKLVDKFIAEIKSQKPQDAGKIGPIIDKALQQLKEDEIILFAAAVKEHIGKDFKNSKAKMKLASFLQNSN